MNNKAIIIVRIFSSKEEHDIEVPLNITAYELFIALNDAFHLNYKTDIKEDCFLRTESPIAFLTGDVLLSEYGLRDGTIINIIPQQDISESDCYLKNFDFSKVSFNCIIDLSSVGNLIIGNSEECNIFIPDKNYEQHRIKISNYGKKFRVDIDKGSAALNGRVVISKETLLNNFDFLNIMDMCFYFNGKKMYLEKTEELELNGVSSVEINENIGAMKYPELIRNSRLKLKINEEPITLLAPKEKPVKPKSNLLLKLMPALGMIALTILLRGVMGKTNIAFVLFSVCSMLMGAIVSVLTIINDRKEYNQRINDREIGYRRYIDRKKQEIEKMREEERNLLDRIYYNYDETSAFAKNFSGNLFDRIPSDEDFLELRIGTGTIDAARKIDYKPQEKYESDDDSLIDLPLKVSEDYKKITNAPILIQVKNANVIGVVGDNNLLYEMVKIMYFDLCIRQHYDDVSTVLIINNNDIKKYEWIKWFKHIKNKDNFRNIVCDEQSRNTVFEYLYAELNQRENLKGKEYKPYIVVFVMNDFGIKSHPISKYIEKASDYGVTFIFFENYKDYIPLGCSQLVLMDSDIRGRIIKNENTEIIDFMYVKVPDSDLYNISHKLAPVYCHEVNLENTLTKSITLYELLGIKSEKNLDLITNWTSSDVTKTLAAPIGVRSGNKIVCLDILDGNGHHGPHGLIAGTTGSGKSEILMTYILSMAVLYNPYEVAFLIIDFKAGGTGNKFKALPHTLGVITDIDGDQKAINRSLISIKAEVERRKKLFDMVKVNHISQYITAWKSKKTKIPLPHLIIIVDEFAELKAQYGDFMSELNSVARVGRSFGIHLILATQKPQGQVDSQIDSNSNFRLCLKVQTPEDSREVIKTPLAAEIREAGRAYFRVGNNEIFELFQSAYSGASSKTEDNLNQREYQLSSVDFAGRRKIIFKKEKPKNEKKKNQVLSQQDAIVKYITDFFKISNFMKLPDICKPPLPTELEYKLNHKIDDVGIYVDLGLFDDPENQKQEIYSVNIALQNMLIIGTLQMGKTNALQLIIRNLSERYSPDEVNFYIVDYSSMTLKNFEKLAHVGGVAVQNEDEKINNLFKFLEIKISERKQKLQSAGINSYIDYKKTGKNDMPLIVLLIDNFFLFKELNPNNNTILSSILRDGLKYGISIVIANGNAKDLGYQCLPYFACRIGLHTNNSDDYSVLFSAFKMSVNAVPGRCIVIIDKRNLECQLYKSFREKETDGTDSIKNFVESINILNPDKKAVRVPEIPEKLFEYTIRRKYASCFQKYDIVLGFDYDNIEPVKMNLCGLNLIVSGISKMGKGNFIKYIISCLEANKEQSPAEIVIFDKLTVRKFKTTAENYSCVKRYELDSGNMASICSEWKEELQKRKQLVLDNHGDMSVLDSKPLLMMICEDSEKESIASFDESLFNYLPYKFTFIASNVINANITSASPKLYKIKDLKASYMFFGSMSVGKTFESLVNAQFERKKQLLNVNMREGDAFYISSNNVTKIYRLKTVIHQDSVM